MPLILVGYWRSPSRPDLPDPADLVDARWDAWERRQVVDYLSNGTVVRRYRGHSSCRICGTPNGSQELSDGRFIWPEGFAHYVSEHDVRPPAEVVQSLVARLSELEGLEVNTSWWPEVARGHIAKGREA